MAMTKVKSSVAWTGLVALVTACAGGTVATGTPVATAPGAISSSASTASPNATVLSPTSGPTGVPATEPPTQPPPTPLPPCTAAPSATTFELDSIVCVAAGPLRVRSKPSTADDSVKFEPLLQNGERLFVMDGPTDGSGYGWYLVQPTHITAGFGAGWVAAAAKDGTPWLGLASIACAPTPTLQDLIAMGAMERLHCYGSRAFTFTATVTWGPMCGDGVPLASPAWLAGCASTFWWGANNSDLVVAIPPELASFDDEVEPDAGFTATITAHMDDAVAASCRPNLFENSDVALSNARAVVLCRATFVATSFTRVSP